MSKRFYTDIQEVPRPILDAYDQGRYTFHQPPVSTAAWDKVAWINFVKFSPDLEKLRTK